MEEAGNERFHSSLAFLTTTTTLFFKSYTGGAPLLPESHCPGNSTRTHKHKQQTTRRIGAITPRPRRPQGPRRSQLGSAGTIAAPPAPLLLPESCHLPACSPQHSRSARAGQARGTVPISHRAAGPSSPRCRRLQPGGAAQPPQGRASVAHIPAARGRAGARARLTRREGGREGGRKGGTEGWRDGSHPRQW